ncbi:uncharacterized protein [Linepithema humile]|uniref:uncharacterized protein n=1 Tax=Linepithema humile TaxID=83485 RepID=UPI00351F1DCB
MLNERYDNQRVIVQKHIKTIFDMPILSRESHTELRQLLDTILKHLRALKVLKRRTDHWDDLLIHVVTSKLAPITNKEWETSLKSANVPTFKELIEFLSQQCRALEAVDRKPQIAACPSKFDKGGTKKATTAHVAVTKTPCIFCKGDHPIFRCDKFIALSGDKRLQEVKERKFCLNCLKSTEHRAKQCTAGSCKKCNKRHNTLIHIESNKQVENVENDASSSRPNPEPSAASVNHIACKEGHQFLLSMAIIQVKNAKRSLHSCRALLDSGSQSNFVTIDLVKRLGLRQFYSCVPISGVGGAGTDTHSSVKICMQSRFNGFKVDLNCLVLRKITQDLPATSIKREYV